LHTVNINILTFDSLDSTNTEALKQARLGADEGLCIVAREQTAGRGRHGRTWISEKDAGLYLSVVLRPKLDAQYLPLITLMAGVAVHDTLEEFGIKADIKWVNDLLVDEKKIAGILAETTETNNGLAVVVGIGINLKKSAATGDVATSIQETGDGRQETGDLAEILTKFLSYFYDILNRENGPAETIDEWRRRSTYFSGKRVRVVLENETVTGVTDGLEPNGALRLQKADGSIAIIQAGDVERLRLEN
ncbi:MAG: biotin--[acetyl-CoA-carboxylase] ligase, partial [Pyrinomonadaceae bacterium]